MRLCILLSLLPLAAPLNAQTGIRPPQGWSLAAFGGGAAFTDFQRDVIRSVGAETSGAIAGSVAYWPSKHWGIRLRAAYAPSRFETVIPQSAAEFTTDSDVEASNQRFASLAISSYEGQLIVRMPTVRGRVMPYGIAGAGVVRYELGDDAPVPDEAESDFESGSQSRAAGTLGLGAALALRPRGWSLNFELTNQLSRTPIRGSGSDRIRITSSVAFMVGASWRLSK